MKAAGLPVIGLDRPSRGQAPDRDAKNRHLTANKRSMTTSTTLSHNPNEKASKK